MPAKQDTSRFSVGRIRCFNRQGWWHAEWYQTGRQRRKALKTRSRKAARQEAEKLEQDLLAGRLRDRGKPKLIAWVFGKYREHLETESRAASTIKRYAAELDRWQGFFDAHDVTRIDRVALALVERYRRLRKPEVAEATLHHECTVLKQVVNFAIQRNWLASNPLAALKLRDPRPTAQPVFDLEQVEQLIAASGHYRDLFELLAFTGLRIGEAIWLTWEDVEIDADGRSGFLHVRAKDGWAPKSRRDRKVPLPDRVLRMLQERPRAHRWIFTARPSPKYPKGGRQVAESRALRKLNSAMKKCGIERGTLHAFRRFFCTHMANHRVPPFQLQQWLGHADLDTVLRYYRLSDGESQRAMAAVPSSAQNTSAETVSADAKSADNAGGKQAQNEHSRSDHAA